MSPYSYATQSGSDEARNAQFPPGVPKAIEKPYAEDLKENLADCAENWMAGLNRGFLVSRLFRVMKL
jgi:hypothetical protein